MSSPVPLDADSARVGAASRWIGIKRPASAPRLKLFAVAYAGSGSMAFRAWPADLDHADWLEFVALQLPGRENRFSEPSYTNMSALLADMDLAIGEMLNTPCVLFGYSLGAVIAYELALRMASRGYPPQHLIVAARAPPYHGLPAKSRTVLTRGEVIEKVRRLGGTAAQLIDSALFDEHFLPILQADFVLADTYHRSVAQILPCPLLALAASDDPEVDVNAVQAWKVAAGGGFEIALFKGGHFFLHKQHEQVIAIINHICELSDTACRREVAGCPQ